jgi:hypothetical protein
VNDFVLKGVPATHVAVSYSGKYIFATFETEMTGLLGALGGGTGTGGGGWGGGGNGKYNKALNRSLSRQNSNSEWGMGDDSPASLPRLMRGDSTGGTGQGAGGMGGGLLGRTSSNSSDQQQQTSDRRGGGGGGNRSHLVMWKQGSLSPNTEEILDLSTPITSLAFGRLDGREGHEIVVLGLLSGEVVISLLPLPIKMYLVAPKKQLPMSMSMSLPQQREHHLMANDSTTGGGGGGSIYTTATSTNVSVSLSAIARKQAKRSHGGAAAGAGGGAAGVGPYDPDEIDSDSEDYALPNTANGSATGIAGGGTSTADDLATNTSTVGPPGAGTGIISASAAAAAASLPTALTYDESLCRIFSLHEGLVTRVLISPSGLWIWSCGVDGSVFMLNTNLKAKDQTDVLEALSNENHISLTDKLMLRTQQGRLEDKEILLEEMAKDRKHTIHQLEIQREKERKLLEETMSREITKRDDIIVQGRNEIQLLQKKSNELMTSLHRNYQLQLSELEVVYEKKLAHETIYISNLKQAYDEYVSHIRLDLEGYQRKAQLQEEKLVHEKEEIIEETEKQKKLLLEYTDYIGERHREVLKVLTETHDDQK